MVKVGKYLLFLNQWFPFILRAKAKTFSPFTLPKHIQILFCLTHIWQNKIITWMNVVRQFALSKPPIHNLRRVHLDLLRMLLFWTCEPASKQRRQFFRKSVTSFTMFEEQFLTQNWQSFLCWLVYPKYEMITLRWNRKGSKVIPCYHPVLIAKDAWCAENIANIGRLLVYLFHRIVQSWDFFGSKNIWIQRNRSAEPDGMYA